MILIVDQQYFYFFVLKHLEIRPNLSVVFFRILFSNVNFALKSRPDLIFKGVHYFQVSTDRSYYLIGQLAELEQALIR